MVTAEEYANTLKRSNEHTRLDVIALTFLHEVRDVLRSGRPLDADGAAVLNEQRKKWKEFCSLSKDCPYEIRVDGFERMIQHELPEIYGAWTVLNPEVTIQG